MFPAEKGTDMPDEQRYRVVFVNRLAYYMNRDGKNQMDLMRDLGFSSSTVSSWCTGKKLPRMKRLQILADYFGVEISDLIEDESAAHKNDQTPFYLNDEEQHLLRMVQYLDEHGKRQLFVRARELIRLGFTSGKDLPESIAAEQPLLMEDYMGEGNRNA